MELNIAERVMLLNVLPATGSLTTLRLIRQLREALSFSEQELQDWEIVDDTVTHQVKWNPEKAGLKDVEIGVKVQEIVVKSLEAQENLSDPYLTLYDRFAEQKA